MASLPSVLLANTLKLDLEFKKLTSSSLPLDKKGSTISHDDMVLSSSNVDFKEVSFLINEVNSRIDPSAYVPMLKECIEKNLVSQVEEIHAHIIKTGADKEMFLMILLVNVYSKCGNLDCARKVFDNLAERNVVTWTSLMHGYVHNKQPDVAFDVFREMLEFGSYPNNYTLGLVLNACSSLGDVKLARQVHGYIIKYQIDHDTSIGNALCSLYSIHGNLDSAIKIFKRIKEKNVISWTAAISACGDNGDSAEGLELFVKMLSEGVEPNDYTLTTVLSLCCVMQALTVGSQVHSLSIKLGYVSNLRVKNSVMYLYLKSGLLIEAKKLFYGMETVSLVTWNAMIAGHAQMMDLAADGVSAHCSGIEALKVFLELHRSGMKPDLFTFSSALTVCSNLTALEQGEQVHAQTIKSGYLSDVVVGTALVNMYNKCGSIDRATKAFVEMPSRTLISWTAMITAFAQHGHSKQALQLFDDMRFIGVRPNQITFVGVLSAFSQLGMVDEALYFFDMMRYEYKIRPVMDHYACLIDMFVRLGQINEAYDLIKKMDFEPNEFIWSMIIAGCRSHGKTELGYYAAEQLLKHNLKDSETYFLLLNMYIAAERWKDVSKVRKIIKDEGFEKLRDWSWISIKDKVYSFKQGSQAHSFEELDNLLTELDGEAKVLGYEPQTSSGSAEEDYKESTTSTAPHSEKLALAFGLLNVPNTAPIRVNKNTSMCRDCHNFMKFISMSTSRTIIVRDSKRLHIFVNGHCSCGDFSNLI
ncbi:hypothetical protein LIER_22206 [Lithospermum erythrorhizon]|uniref:DYW domain-containing protein n=1 Tax=Lithospermum erythrorhizon TaxID=34254 RepID=A0AAV3QW42_LITER